MYGFYYVIIIIFKCKKTLMIKKTYSLAWF